MSTHRLYKEVITLVTSEKKRKSLEQDHPCRRGKDTNLFFLSGWLCSSDLVLCWCQSSEEMQRSVVLKAFITQHRHQNNQVLPHDFCFRWNYGCQFYTCVRLGTVINLLIIKSRSLKICFQAVLDVILCTVIGKRMHLFWWWNLFHTVPLFRPWFRWL